MSSSSDKPKGMQIMPNKKKKKKKKDSNFCSTPVAENVRTLSSISVSAVDTNSSSSTNKKIVQMHPEKRQTKKKKLEKKRLSQRMKEKQKRKEKKKEKKRGRKKKLIEQRQSDNDWETYDESLQQPPKLENNVLFEDIRSPEQVREARYFTHDRLDSPITRPRGWEVDSPNRIIFEEKEGTLPVKDLPFSHMRFDDSDDDEEDMLSLKRQNIVKTYLGLRNEKARNKNARIEKCKEWLVNVTIPTASSDLLWDNFVRNNYEKISKYLARPVSKKKMNERGGRKNINNNNDDSSEERDNHGEESVKGKYEIPSELREKMSVVRGYWDKSLRKWVQVCDVYNFPESKDMELDKSGGTVGKMTLNQYLRKRKARKRNAIELDSNSSSPRYQQSVEQNFKNLKSTLDEEKMEKETSRGMFKSASKMPKIMMADASGLELQRINEVRKFASRLNAKEKTMISNETSLASTSKDVVPSCTTISLKRRHMDDLDDEQIEGKTLKIIKTKNKPVIKSVESLVEVRLKRDKKNWRIM